MLNLSLEHFCEESNTPQVLPVPDLSALTDAELFAGIRRLMAEVEANAASSVESALATLAVTR